MIKPPALNYVYHLQANLFYLTNFSKKIKKMSRQIRWARQVKIPTRFIFPHFSYLKPFLINILN